MEFILVLVQEDYGIIPQQKILEDLNQSFIIDMFKGKGDTLEGNSYRGLKFTEHGLKVIKRIMEKVHRSIVDFDEMQFGFMLGKGTHVALFILEQLQEKHITKGKHLYFRFVCCILLGTNRSCVMEIVAFKGPRMAGVCYTGNVCQTY